MFLGEPGVRVNKEGKSPWGGGGGARSGRLLVIGQGKRILKKFRHEQSVVPSLLLPPHLFFLLPVPSNNEDVNQCHNFTLMKVSNCDCSDDGRPVIIME